MLVLAFLVVGIASRLLIHAPNFTPVLALALFGGTYLSRREALWVPLALMMVSDAIIGFHATIPFTWGSILLISLVGFWLRGKVNAKRTIVGGLLSAVVFFVVTNFGAWLAYYPKTWAGLSECYVLAIPFFRSTLLGTLVYAAVFFGLYEVIASRVRNTKLAPVLLK